jgi:hypothetical protein
MPVRVLQWRSRQRRGRRRYPLNFLETNHQQAVAARRLNRPPIPSKQLRSPGVLECDRISQVLQ